MIGIIMPLKCKHAIKKLTCYLTILFFLFVGTLANAAEGVRQSPVVVGLDSYYAIGGWLGNGVSSYFKQKVMEEVAGLKWTQIHESVPKSAADMYVDGSRVQSTTSEEVELWGLENNIAEVGAVGTSTAYKYRFNCKNSNNSSLLYAVRFSELNGRGDVRTIDTHFNGRWWRGNSDQVDQSLNNFLPFKRAACEYKKN